SRPPSPDEKNEGKLACTVSFRLPPGGYATLVLKRLFPESFAPARKARRPDERPRPSYSKNGERRAASPQRAGRSRDAPPRPASGPRDARDQQRGPRDTPPRPASGPRDARDQHRGPRRER